VVVAGTGTEVGKTWVAARLACLLVDSGVRVSARKPAQSFEPDDPTTDADELAGATGEDPEVVCPPHRRYLVPMAPPMAADVLGAPAIVLADLVSEVAASWSAPAADVGLVELAGGVRSPAAHDGDGVDLTAALAPGLVLVVADAGLGTINAVRLTVDALAGIAPVVVHLNRFDPDDDLHRRNRDWLADRCGMTVTTDLGDLADAVR
jgi:dethiobiotin synthetase